MLNLLDVHGRTLRMTDERLEHLEEDHPEMAGQVSRIAEAVGNPERIVGSRTDPEVDLYYRHYERTPVATKFLCVVVKNPGEDGFVLTAYFTDSIKRGVLKWPTT